MHLQQSMVLNCLQIVKLIMQASGYQLVNCLHDILLVVFFFICCYIYDDLYPSVVCDFLSNYCALYHQMIFSNKFLNYKFDN